MSDVGQPFPDGVKLDPKNLDASLKALEEYMVGLRIERSSAQTALRAHSEFVTMIAHEVRTSLGAIFAFSDLLLSSELNEEQYGHAYNLRSTADGLLHLLDEVLDHTKLTEGRMELSIKPFNLNELITSFAITLDARCAAKGLASTVHHGGDLPAVFLGDSMRLRQILVNFADNAVRFTEDGTIALAVERVGSLPGATKIRFSLSDTGAGFDKETRERLFMPYEQGDQPDSQGGAGLGLSICAKLVELMGGEVGCDSEPGAGSHFWFEVVLDRVSETSQDDEDLFADTVAAVTPAAGEPAEAEKVAETPDEQGPLRTARPALILLVDDNKVDQMLVSTYLKKFGHTYAIAQDGYEAIDMMKATRFDLVLMDLQLPELDGFQTTAAMRRLGGRHIDIPIIAITANMLHARRKTWQDADMDACLTKPIDALHLFKTIAHFRDNGRAQPAQLADLPPVDTDAVAEDGELFEGEEELA